MAALRTFVAVLLAPEARLALVDLIPTLARSLPAEAVRWSGGDRIHLTLRFLGDTDPGAVGAIGAALDAVASRFSRFDTAMGELGCFPNRRRPKVIWLGLADPTGVLAELKAILDEALLELGWQAEERPFVPHLTLGRVRGEARIPDEAVWTTRPLEISVPVESLHLMQSHLKPGGAEYTALHRADLLPGFSVW
jgi:2'-5' RNA ligase